MNAALAIVASALTIFIGVWKYMARKNRFRREEAEKAKKDFENAKANDSKSDFLDSFNRLR